MTVSEPRPRHRWWLRLLLTAIITVGVLVAGVLWRNALSSSDVKAAIAEADDLDPGWRLADLEAKRDAPPDAENAAVQLLAVVRQFPKAERMHAADKLLEGLPPAARLRETQLAAVRATLADAGPALEAARGLTRFTRSRYPIAWQPLPMSTLLNSQEARAVAAWLRLSAYSRAEAVDHAGALADYRGILHASRTIGDEPTGISMLIRIATRAVAILTLERLLAQGELPIDALADVQRELEAEDQVPLLLIAMRGERASVDQTTENMYGTTSPLERMQLLVSPASVHPYRTRAAAIRFTSELVEIAKLPEEQRKDRWAAAIAGAGELPLMIGLLAPAIDKIAIACARGHAQTRCAIAAVAAERFRRAKGRWPETPAELVKDGFLKQVPSDPFDFQPLRLKRTGTGVLIYSIGPDGKDDGGTIERGGRLDPGTDWGFELWDLDKRRQPPVPPKAKEADDGPGRP